MRLSAALLVLGLTATLPGCAALRALEGEPDRDIYELRQTPDPPQKCARGRLGELVIQEPTTRGTLDTDRIMIRTDALRTEYLPDSRWGDDVPTTLQTMLVRSFGNYDVFSYVGRAPLALNDNYAIFSEIVDYNAEVAGKGAIVRLSVDAQMVRVSDARVMSQEHFRTTATSSTTRTSDLMPAFDKASQQLISQMTDWGMKTVGVNAAHCH